MLMHSLFACTFTYFDLPSIMSSEPHSSQPRYWCHVCSAEVPIYMAPDPTCQHCNEQFIEELQSDDDPREFLAGTENTANNNTNENSGSNTSRDNDANPFSSRGGTHFFTYSTSTGRMNNADMGDDIFQYFAPRNNTEETRGTNNSNTNTPNTPQNNVTNFVQNLLSTVLGPNVDISAHNPAGTADNPESVRPIIFYGNMVDGNMRFQPAPGNPLTSNMPGGIPAEDNGEPRTGTNEELRGNNIASIMQFISAITGSPLDAGLVGNPNDYVFSRAAFDNIITQLMEQTAGSTAPPPAPEQVIESLPKRPLTEEETRQEVDCAVCKDTFVPEETVIILPCDHIFHDDCIKPWLKLNGTCPVCRHSVIPEHENKSNEGDNHATSSSQDTSANSNRDTQNTNEQPHDINNSSSSHSESTSTTNPPDSSSANETNKRDRPDSDNNGDRDRESMDIDMIDLD
ncbi:hypothetical protein BDB01DRAFT_896077 [Pilobolus umbonatus]|nr:hypothetical protein BDB01DRAFT_896077 [Pilobolus umbonatus]